MNIGTKQLLSPISSSLLILHLKRKDCISIIFFFSILPFKNTITRYNKISSKLTSITSSSSSSPQKYKTYYKDCVSVTWSVISTYTGVSRVCNTYSVVSSVVSPPVWQMTLCERGERCLLYEYCFVSGRYYRAGGGGGGGGVSSALLCCVSFPWLSRPSTDWLTDWLTGTICHTADLN